MRIQINRQARLPIFRQIEISIARAIQQGTLKTAHKLPSTRELACAHGLNRMTVENAYSALEARGLIERRHGSGTFVLKLNLTPAGPTPESSRVPPWLKRHQPEKITWNQGKQKPSARYDFSSGMGDPRLIPSMDFRRVMQAVVRKQGNEALGYEAAQGHLGLRTSIAEILSAQGLPARSGQILITTGAQQAISLAAQALLRPGDCVAIEGTSYDSAIALFHMLGLKVLCLPCDAEGLVIEGLEPRLKKHRPRLLYCIPSFQNPTSTVLPVQRRQALVTLAHRYNFPILEDDYVGELRYEGFAVPTLKSLDRHGGVLYTSTFSKMLMPGLRVGFLMGEEPVIQHLTLWKQRLEISGPSVVQRALHAYISVGRYRRHLRKACRVYRARRDAMITAIREHFPKDCEFTTPSGGLFLWIKVSNKRLPKTLQEHIQQAGIAVAWGDRFFADKPPQEQWLRLNFASNEIPEIEHGIRLLGQLLRQRK